MSHVEKCPVCEGSGSVHGPDPPCPLIDCHGCAGKGWVAVEDAPVDVQSMASGVNEPSQQAGTEGLHISPSAEAIGRALNEAAGIGNMGDEPSQLAATEAEVLPDGVQAFRDALKQDAACNPTGGVCCGTCVYRVVSQGDPSSICTADAQSSRVEIFGYCPSWKRR